ncbi:aconitase/3-isopropylmalate dehydratase large subunit family protein [Pseudobutyrivibrio ruminis]|uniref:aconitase/3-isopropylmalate dehydratase large subunit family protein n=1 Tax=Pseudobutyrivibrio ruminis TaxID=46206 RepID=UPI00040A2081|nr:aconitase/3-isopropylmalate dehydratase large subunit family protein [Pseudobutyrivibrio ruminis]
MGHTLVEKIIGNKVGGEVKPGDIVTVPVDWCMIDDIMVPFAVQKFQEMGFAKVAKPDSVVLIYDHFLPATQVDDTRHFRVGDEFAEKYGIKHIHRTDGICHQLMTEAGYVKPGDIAFGTDSHTVTYGCVGAFATGIGYTEMAGILGTGELWVRVPESIKVEINGKLPKNVMSKDVILRIIGDLTASGATYQSIEFTGSTIDEMSIASRMTMSNMAVEAGAKCGLFTPDEKTCEYCNIPFDDSVKALMADYDAVYSKVLKYDAKDFVPVLACPSLVDNIHPVADAKGTKVDQVFLGSCTNGRLEDLQAAAAILKGKHVAPFVKMIVTPASRKIYRQALSDGTLQILSDAGCIITTPGCGLCCGRGGGILSDDEVVVATNNRNFLGRMGTSKVKIYLASPATAAATAIAGTIVEA